MQYELVLGFGSIAAGVMLTGHGVGVELAGILHRVGVLEKSPDWGWEIAGASAIVFGVIALLNGIETLKRNN